MPLWSKIVAGLTLAAALIGFAAFAAYSKKLGPLVQEHGTTYYNGEGPVSQPLACKPESEILAAIKQVHAKYDYLSGDDLKAFESRADRRKGPSPAQYRRALRHHRGRPAQEWGDGSLHWAQGRLRDDRLRPAGTALS